MSGVEPLCIVRLKHHYSPPRWPIGNPTLTPIARSLACGQSRGQEESARRFSSSAAATVNASLRCFVGHFETTVNRSPSSCLLRGVLLTDRASRQVNGLSSIPIVFGSPLRTIPRLGSTPPSETHSPPDFVASRYSSAMQRFPPSSVIASSDGSRSDMIRKPETSATHFSAFAPLAPNPRPSPLRCSAPPIVPPPLSVTSEMIWCVRRSDWDSVASF